MPRAVYRNTNEEFSFVATSVIAVGQLVQRLGKVWFIKGEQPTQIGELAVGCRNAVVEVEKQAASDVYAEGADVYWDDAALTAFTGAGGARFLAGKAGASAAGETSVKVYLNL